MSLIPERLRPPLAGLLGTVATGFGHFYLRRWLRGLGWLALAFAVTVLFVSPEAIQTMADTGTPDPETLYPAMIVQLVGAFDAALLAYRSRSPAGAGDGDGPAVVAGREAGDGQYGAAHRDANTAADTTVDATANAAATDAADAADGADATVVACPNCGKEVDADLGFCHWCTTEFVTPDGDAN